MTRPVAFESRVRVPHAVMMREVAGECVILNLESERYYGLDVVGTRFWTALTESDSIQAAYETLLEEYDAAPDDLRHDLTELVANLSAEGLLLVEAAPETV